MSTERSQATISSQSTSGVFRQIERNGESIWMHASLPVFIVRYDAIPGVRVEFYRAYRAIANVPKGRAPWTVDNDRIGTERGFATLAEAVEAAS
jgi:hypothetical protein